MPLRTCLSFCIFFLLTACLQTKIPEQHFSEQHSLALAASQAWQNKDYARSGPLYQRLLASKQVQGSQALLAWKRMTYAGLNSHNYKIAQAGAKGWETADPGARQDWQWLQADFLINAQVLSQEAQEKDIRQFLLRQDLTWKEQTRVLDFVFNRLWQEKNYRQALFFARVLYTFAPEYDQTLLQSKIIFALENLSLSELQTLTPQYVKKFPDNCVMAVLTQKQAGNNTIQGRQEYERYLDLSGTWSDQFPFQEELIKQREEVGAPKQSIALLLPLSGNYAKLSGKILQGTEIGLQFLFKNGFSTSVRVINSQADDWQAQLRNLPSSVTFIGGPLQKETWQQIIKDGLHTRYVFFSFLSQLDKEGQYGWRFFSSPQDQVRSLIEACKEQQDIQDFAILYPEERYGKEMTKIFWEELQKNGLYLKGMQAYTPGKHKTWGGAVAKLLGKKQNSKKNWRPEFDAVFLPDSFSAARQLVPSFFYNDAGKILFLGPQIWGNSLTAADIEKTYFSNSLFPGAWWRQNPAPAARFLSELLGEKEDTGFWEALGFDFVRFLARIEPLSPTWTAQDVNSRLEACSQKMDWTLAPLFWDTQGFARQKMYVFRTSDPQGSPLPITKDAFDFFQKPLR